MVSKKKITSDMVLDLTGGGSVSINLETSYRNRSCSVCNHTIGQYEPHARLYKGNKDWYHNICSCCIRFDLHNKLNRMVIKWEIDNLVKAKMKGVVEDGIMSIL